MEINRKSSIQLALFYCKKFGFISKSFFWDYLSPGTLSTKYRYWDIFLSSKFFVPYQEIDKSSEFFYLNHRTVNLSLNDLEYVGRRNPLYFNHDDQIMRMIFLLEKANLIKQYWTEPELKANRSLALDLLGGDYSKLPDAVFDLNILDQTFRIVFEVEMTRKSNDRYLRSFIGYNRFRKIDLILFGTNQARIVQAIKSAAFRKNYNNPSKPLGFVDLKKFSDSGIGSPLEINSKVISLDQFLRSLIDIKSSRTELKIKNACEKNEKNFAQHLIE